MLEMYVSANDVETWHFFFGYIFMLSFQFYVVPGSVAWKTAKNIHSHFTKDTSIRLQKISGF